MEKSVTNSEIEMSVIVAVIEGGNIAMRDCLTALEPSIKEHTLEVLVPYDARLDGVDELETKFPWAQFIDARASVDAEDHGDSSREHHDILRSIGIEMAKGPIVALLEDHGTPSPGWCTAVLENHRSSNAAGIGGAVENGVDRLLNWAVYYCDFGRYQNPVPSGPVEFLSDSNVSYKRDALWSVKKLWTGAFHETSVNWELRRLGYELNLNPEMVVHQTRRRLRFLPALRERFVWGRSFAGTRAMEISGTRRLVFGAFSCLLPMVLTLRIVMQGLQKRRHLDKLIFSLPFVFLLEVFWSIGEFVGYLTRKSASDRELPVQATT
jgi:hypothetical protein